MLTKDKIKFLRSLHTKAGRSASGLFIAEGEKLTAELKALMTICQEYRVGRDCTVEQMGRISALKTPTSVLATFYIPEVNSAESYTQKGRVLVLDGVQDPGNVGTILRTADWFGVRRVVCSAHTADAFGSKVVQATMGAIGRLEIIYTNVVEWLEEREKHFPATIYGTFLERSEPFGGIEIDRNATIVVGNEGQGISREVERLVSRRVVIERGEGGSGESLNVAVATAIILAKC